MGVASRVRLRSHCEPVNIARVAAVNPRGDRRAAWRARAPHEGFTRVARATCHESLARHLADLSESWLTNYPLNPARRRRRAIVK